MMRFGAAGAKTLPPCGARIAARGRRKSKTVTKSPKKVERKSNEKVKVRADSSEK